MQNIIGLRELRENLKSFILQVGKGKSFIVMRKNKPVFKISPIEEKDELWEEAADFTKLKKGGVEINELLSRL